VQTYYDRTFRYIPLLFKETRDTYDIDFQHRFPAWERHDILWGGGYRVTHDQVANTYSIAWNPPSRSLQLFSAFVQDEIALVRDRLALTIGSKFEHNDYSGFEVQPTIRLAWTPTTNQTVWGAVSRAVRSPSRLDADIEIKGPLPFPNFPGSYTSFRGNPEFDSEKLTAFELGYRIQPLRRISLDLSVFYNVYDDLRSIEPGPLVTNGIITQTSVLANNLKGETYGAELGLNYQMLEWWRWNGGYTYLHKDLRRKPGSLDITEGTPEGNDPSHQFFLRSYMDLPQNFEFDSGFRYIDNLPSPYVSSYVVADMRLGWRPWNDWEFSVAGQNLFRQQHREFGSAATAREIEQSVYGKVTWRF
jgi:iron complex outermembrane receptor protein